MSLLVSLTSSMSPRTMRAPRSARPTANGLADATGGSRHQRNPSGMGFSGLACWHVTGPSVLANRFCYEMTAGLSASSHHCRKLVGVEFSGVRWTALSMPSFFAQAMSVIPWAIASDMPKLTKRSL